MTRKIESAKAMERNSSKGRGTGYPNELESFELDRNYA
jgi:hypothetical protein